MPVEINISDEDISYSEKVLLPTGKIFDDERVTFIKNLETIDLQAVPGSGKTTALLAKLVILERKLPFPNGSGILVISHTNAAVDEIKDKIQKHCPKLFSYPNFIGTIQSFIDEFLAVPYFNTLKHKKPYRIDNEIFFEKFEFNYPQKLQYGLKQRLGNNYDSFLEHITIKEETLIDVFAQTEIDIPNAGKGTDTYRELVNTKKYLFDLGCLTFNEAYYLANVYLKQFPRIRKIIQERFSLVFVDEMQDMEQHQYQLLEDLFFDNGNSVSKYQRIGDKNQAIFSGNSKIQNLWIDRENKLELNGSHRLSENIAKVVQPFALQPIEIIGLRKNSDGSDISVSPHIILYDNDSKENIILKFAEIIRDYKEKGEIPNDSSNKYYAIAWNSVWERQQDIDNPNKLRLKDYYSDYSREEARKSIDYSTLESYLNFYDESIKSLYAVRKSILNAFIKILRLEKLYDKNSKDGQRDRIFTKRNLLKYFREEQNNFYYEFKLLIFKWSFAVAKGEKEKVIEEIRDFIPTFLLKFERANPAFDNKINQSRDFVKNPCPLVSNNGEENPNAEKRNLIIYEGVGEIQVGTVHSVKGQTHTATLYLETSYYSDGGKSYESQRLSEQFKANNLNGTEGERVKQSAKMAYVGFSRPTHLLCLGIHKERFETSLKENLPDYWKVVDC